MSTKEVIIIKIVDAIMGAGKTTAMINLINTDPRKNYLYVTPYLDEVKRIKKDCGFSEPKQLGEGKLTSLNWLLENKRSIACTHALFTMFTEETVKLLKDGDYILILDETIEPVIIEAIPEIDVQAALAVDLLKYEDNGKLTWTDDTYEFGCFYNLKKQVQNYELYYKHKCFYKVMRPDIFFVFKEVYVLTYMFDSQIMKYWADWKQIPYEYYHIENSNLIAGYNGYGKYSGIKDLIFIVDNPKLNEIGNKRTALSATWFQSAPVEDIDRVRKNTLNLYHNIFGGKSSDSMWTCLKENKSKLTGTGYGRGFVSCNTRATNKYSNKTNLAYLINRYPSPFLHNFLKDCGVKIDSNKFALSEMVQWVWRSAIRNNKKINIYIPSKRMRTLFSNWINKINE